MALIHFHRKPALSDTRKQDLLSIVRKELSPRVKDIETEYCFNVEASAPLSDQEMEILRWLLAETFEPQSFSARTFLVPDAVVEVGPRMNFTTAWSTNAVSICHTVGLAHV